MIVTLAQEHALYLVLTIIAALLLAAVILILVYRQQAREAAARERELKGAMLELRAKECDEKRHTEELEKTKAALMNMMEDLTESYEKLKQLDELKTDFVTNVSHELRTPLTSLILGLDLLEKERDPKKRGEMMAMLRRNAERLQRTVHGILDYSVIEAGRMQLERKPFSLDGLLASVAEAEHPKAAAKGVRLTASSPPLTALGDAEWVERALLNIVDNAIKFTDRGGVAMTARMEKGHISVAVKDTGRGIRKRDLPRVFEKFTKFERHVPGTGLGLWLSKQVIEKLGGQIRMASVRGKGKIGRAHV
jgi:signal transduction histidine kinase